MGSGAIAGIVAATSAIFGGYSQNKQQKKQASAANAMADAMANQPEQKIITSETKDLSKAQDTVNDAARRRLSLNKTVNTNTLGTGTGTYGSPFKRTTLG